MEGILYVNELEVIKISKEWILPQFVHLHVLKDFGYEKTKDYNPITKEFITAWVKNPKEKKKNKPKKGCVRKK